MNEFDPALLSQVRLGVVSVLFARGETSFADLRALLDATQGNLGMHLQKLEEVGYVKARRDGAGRGARSTFKLTAKGRASFLGHVERLRRIADGCDPG